MDKLFNSLKEIFQKKGVVTENPIFRLQSKITVCFLLACSLLCTANAYIGNPIFCMTKDDIPKDLISTYCWIHNTFSVDDAWHKEVGDEVIYPGVSQYKIGEKRTFHSYYQWVPFVLLLQAFICYLGKYFWSIYEDNRIQNIRQGLDNPVLDQKILSVQLEKLLDYLCNQRKQHRMYFYAYAIAEVINFFSLVGQMFLMDCFLGGYFSTYGSDVLSFTEYDWSVRYDPMIRVFPRVTKCTFHRFGPSGNVQKHDSLCVLPMNIVNEKIYVFLWFWFILLAILTGLSIVYRAVSALVPRVRSMALYSRCSRCDKDNLSYVIDSVSLGDYMILNNLSKNIDSKHFSALIDNLSDKFQTTKFRDVA